MPTTHEPLHVLTDDLVTDIEERVSREERVLIYLLKHPLQRRQDLALALSCHPSSISRYLARLEERNLVERLIPAFGRTRTSVCYYLTTRGIEQVASWVGATPSKLAALWGADEAHLVRLLPRLSGLFLLQDVINGLVEQAPRRLAPKGVTSIPLRWHWQRDYQHGFVSKHKRYSVQVDAVLVFARQKATALSPTDTPGQMNYQCAFLVLDGGWEGKDDLALIKERLITLLRFRESAERWAHYHQFPPLLVLTTSARQREHWQRCAREAASGLRLPPLQGAVVTLPTEQAIPSPWQLAWHHLGQPGPSHLPALLLPMPQEAVPEGLLAPKALPAGFFMQEGARTSGTVVKGQFNQRAQTSLQKGVKNLPRLEHEMLAWVGLSLTQQQRNVLLQIYAHPWLSPQELAVLLDVQTETIMHCLSPLRRWGCLESHSTEMGERLALGERGLRFVAALFSMSLTHVAEVRHKIGAPLVQRGITSLQHTIRHTTGIYRFITQLTHEARAQGHRLLWWETGARCARRYLDHRVWHNLLPDARLAYQAGEHIMHVWLEWDEGTMRTPGLTTKFSAYAHYLRSHQWRQDEDILPILLMVLPDPGQEQRVQRVARMILQDTTLQLYTTTVTRLEREGLLTPIWWLMSSH